MFIALVNSYAFSTPLGVKCERAMPICSFAKFAACQHATPPEFCRAELVFTYKHSTPTGVCRARVALNETPELG